MPDQDVNSSTIYNTTINTTYNIHVPSMINPSEPRTKLLEVHICTACFKPLQKASEGNNALTTHINASIPEFPLLDSFRNRFERAYSGTGRDLPPVNDEAVRDRVNCFPDERPVPDDETVCQHELVLLRRLRSDACHLSYCLKPINEPLLRRALQMLNLNPDGYTTDQLQRTMYPIFLLTRAEKLRLSSSSSSQDRRDQLLPISAEQEKRQEAFDSKKRRATRDNIKITSIIDGVVQGNKNSERNKKYITGGGKDAAQRYTENRKEDAESHVENRKEAAGSHVENRKEYAENHVENRNDMKKKAGRDVTERVLGDHIFLVVCVVCVAVFVVKYVT